MNKYLLSSLAAVAVSASAFAADKNDIVLGFWADGGTGVSSNVQVVLADTSALKPLQTLNVLTNVGSLLSSTYGSNWATRTDLHFGYVGAVPAGQTGTGGEGARTVYAASVATSSLLDGVQTGTAYIRKSTSSQGTVATSTNTLYGSFGSNSAIVANAADPGSWTYQTFVSGVPGFGNFFAVNQFVNNVDFSTSSYVASDLFEMLPSSTAGIAGTFLGTFALYANGDVAFANTAIPEPSTYAAILGAAALGFAAYRRRQLASA